MWHQPWTHKEGFLICGGLFLTGLMLNASVGNLQWDALRWPVSGVGALLFVALNVALFLLRQRFYALRFLATLHAAVPTLVCAVGLTVVMGLTRQSAVIGGIHDMLSFWPFVLLNVYLSVLLAQVCLKRIAAFRWRRDVPFLCHHLGLFIALTAGTLSAIDLQRLHMVTTVGEPEWRAVDDKHNVTELPIAIELKRFVMEEYAAESDNNNDTTAITVNTRSPKRFASDIHIFTRKGENIHTTVEVNHPVSIDGWKIYQYGYDQAMGAMSRTSIFELVRDPWLPLVYAGIGLMLLGALCLLILPQRHP